MRIFKAGHALFLLLIVTFGLFLANTFWQSGPPPEPAGDTTVTVFTDLPGPPDAPALGLGGAMLGLAVLCTLFAFASTAFAASRCQRAHKPAALLN